MIDKSESISNLAAALVQFQMSVEKIKKQAKNPFFKSSYATLAQILDAIKTPLADNKLAFSQFPSGDNKLTTILMHESGEYLMATVDMKPAKEDPQALGSAITYMRRYALGAVLGLNIDNDDDGNLASGRTFSGAGTTAAWSATGAK